MANLFLLDGRVIRPGLSRRLLLVQTIIIVQIVSSVRKLGPWFLTSALIIPTLRMSRLKFLRKVRVLISSLIIMKSVKLTFSSGPILIVLPRLKAPISLMMSVLVIRLILVLILILVMRRKPFGRLSVIRLSAVIVMTMRRFLLTFAALIPKFILILKSSTLTRLPKPRLLSLLLMMKRRKRRGRVRRSGKERKGLILLIRLMKVLLLIGPFVAGSLFVFILVPGRIMVLTFIMVMRLWRPRQTASLTVQKKRLILKVILVIFLLSIMARRLNRRRSIVNILALVMAVVRLRRQRARRRVLFMSARFLLVLMRLFMFRVPLLWLDELPLGLQLTGEDIFARFSSPRRVPFWSRKKLCGVNHRCKRSKTDHPP